MRFYLCEGGLGDAISLTATVREYHKAYPTEPIFVSTSHRYDRVFRYNPHITAKGPKDARSVALRLEEDSGIGNIAVSFGRQAGIEVSDWTPEFYFPFQYKPPVIKPFALPKRPVIAFDPSARAATRRYPWELWHKALSCLAKKFTLIRVGRTETDYESLKRIKIPPLPCDVDVSDALDLEGSAYVLSMSDLYLGSDSGCAHLAAAVGTPQVIIYSRSRWYSRGYWNTTPVTSVLHPCMGPLCDRVCGNPNGFCLDRIPPSRVVEAVVTAYSRFGRKNA